MCNLPIDKLHKVWYNKVSKEREETKMKMTISCSCPFCGAISQVEVKEKDWDSYQKGALAQRAFPYLSATDREIIISHICPKCQERIFGE